MFTRYVQEALLLRFNTLAQQLTTNQPRGQQRIKYVRDRTIVDFPLSMKKF